MTTVKAFIRTGKKDKEANIRFRLSDGRNVQLFHKSELMVLPTLWDEKRELYKAKSVIKTEERIRLNTAIAERKKLLLSLYNNTPEITSDKLERLIDEHIHPEKYQKQGNDFFSIMETYLQKKKLSEVREKNFRVLVRALQRYELFVSAYDTNKFKLELDKINTETIEDIESFLRNESNLYEEYPEIYRQIPAIINPKRKSTKPQPRGNNTICALFNKLRAFYNWCNQQKITDNRPFERYNGVTIEKYGTPFYLTLDERNLIADYDLSTHPQLAIQRDIFIFQCLIGCRVSDLLKMTQDNIINEAIEYIPHKTKDERPIVVRVPLNERAKAIIDKYKGINRKDKLLPFISAQKYNDDIKEIFRLCGITRSVTVLNSTTGKEEKKPINEVASSHMARRTFVGNLYKKVKDPSLVGSLSGHAEGSKAFARYREIDDDIKKELVNMIE
ncbi:MAG: site-specific integrase [Bacteroides graminisolvens]|nr:site-specific integrase [Bacteroides graminisolvens]